MTLVKFNTKNMNPEQPTVEEKISNEQEKELGIKNAKSFKELTDFIEKTDGLKGTKTFYEPHTILNLIFNLRSGKIGTSEITRTNGLREKVIELLNIQKGREEQIINGLMNVKSFDNLYNFIDAVGSIEAGGTSDEEYNSKQLRNFLDGVRYWETKECGDFRMIPSTGGLKEKVSELLDLENKK